MPGMTKEQAIATLELDRNHSIGVGLNKDLQEAQRIAIEALRDIPEQRCTTCDVNELRKELQVCQHTNKTLYEQATAAEEALKAMERERAKNPDFRPWIANNIKREQIIEILGAELQAEREKVEKMKEFAKSRYCKDIPGVYQKIIELWPDPEPELHDWAWALEELKAGRKVCRESWMTGCYLALENGVLLFHTHNRHSGMHWTPIETDFTEPGWLPFEEEK